MTLNPSISPLRSLQTGTWVKLIGGASFQDLPALRSLAIAYGLAGIDCIDLAADGAVIEAVQEGITVAQNLVTEAQKRGFSPSSSPWLMVSLNDGEDPHFRKAYFDPIYCPTNCPRPCESICPAQAINNNGIMPQRCYGCGRCLPICPLGLITAHSHQVIPTEIASLLRLYPIDALELHTQVGHQQAFQTLWSAIAPSVKRLKILAISCPEQPDVLDYLHFLDHLIQPLPCPLIWQTDGRSMSGDIGKGTTHAAIRLAQKVLESDLPGYVQLAGGTNAHTLSKLKSLNLLDNSQSDGRAIAGIAYGSYARSQLVPLLNELEKRDQTFPQLEQHPDLLWQAVAIAASLVTPLKKRHKSN
jgi:Fe-S-cluster-containing hydrogenase component 2